MANTILCNEVLRTKIGNTVVSAIPAHSNTSGFATQTIDVHNYANSVQTIEFSLDGVGVLSEVQVQNVHMVLEVNLGNDTTVCGQSSFFLDCGIANADSYSWSTGATTRTINATHSGTYSVTVQYHGRTLTDDITIDMCTGIDVRELQNRVNVYPNPASNNLNISVPQELTNSEIKISSIQGQTVYSARINVENSSIDVSSFAPGTYIVTINNPQAQTINKRFVKL